MRVQFGGAGVRRQGLAAAVSMAVVASVLAVVPWEPVAADPGMREPLPSTEEWDPGDEAVLVHEDIELATEGMTAPGEGLAVVNTVDDQVLGVGPGRGDLDLLLTASDSQANAVQSLPGGDFAVMRDMAASGHRREIVRCSVDGGCSTMVSQINSEVSRWRFGVVGDELLINHHPAGSDPTPYKNSGTYRLPLSEAVGFDMRDIPASSIVELPDDGDWVWTILESRVSETFLVVKDENNDARWMSYASGEVADSSLDFSAASVPSHQFAFHGEAGVMIYGDSGDVLIHHLGTNQVAVIAESAFGAYDAYHGAAVDPLGTVFVRRNNGDTRAVFRIENDAIGEWFRTRIGGAWDVSVADPVSTATGAFIDATTDLASPAGTWGLDLERRYTSVDPTVGALGRGWMTGLDTSVEVSSDGDGDGTEDWVRWRMPSGRLVYFVQGPNTSDPWQLPAGFPEMTLTRDEEDRLVVTELGVQTWRFGSLGQLAEMTNLATGETVDVSWANGFLLEAVASSGWKLRSTVDPASTPTWWSVDLVGPGQSTGSGLGVTYHFGDDGLMSVDYRNGVQTESDAVEYSYDDQGRVASIAAGGEVQAENEYDAFGRVAAQEVPGALAVTVGASVSGEVVGFEYGWEPLTFQSGATAATTVSWGGGTPTEENVAYEIDGFGHVIDITDPLAVSVSRGWATNGAPAGRLGQLQDRRGETTSQTFDTTGLLQQRTRPALGSDPALVDQVAYEPGGLRRIVASAEPGGTTTEYVWDNGNSGDDTTDRVPGAVLVCATPPGQDLTNGLGSGEGCDPGPDTLETTIVSSDDRTLSVTDGDDVTSTSTYGSPCAAVQLCSTTTGGVTTDYAYQATTGLLASVTTPDGTTTFGDDARGRQVLVDPPGDGDTRLGFDAAGRVSWESGLGNADTDGPGGSNGEPSVAYTYWPDGLIQDEIWLIDASGDSIDGNHTTATTRHAYDAQRRLATVTTGHGTGAAATTSYTYGVLDRLLSVTDPAGVITWYCYDADGNQIREAVAVSAPSCEPGDPSGTTRESTTEYDEWGRPYRTVNAEGMVTETELDPAGRVVRVTTAVGTSDQSIEEYDYDPLGRVAKVRRQVGDPEADPPIVVDVEWRTYTPGGRLDKVCLPPANALTDGSWATFDSGCDGTGERKRTFDYQTEDPGEPGYGAVEAVTDPIGAVTSYGFDEMGRVNDVSGSAVATPTSSEFDTQGRLTKETRAASNGNEVSRRTLYHGDGQVASVTDWDTNPDASGVPTRAFDYNDAGWLTEAVDANEVPVTYVYDVRGNRLERHSRLNATTPVVQSWTYDTANRLTSATDGENNTTTYGYGPSTTLPSWGRLVSVSDPSGRTGTYGYDIMGRVATETWTKTGLDTITVGRDYDLASRPDTITRTVGANPTETTSYAYDAAGNIASVQNPGAYASLDPLIYTWTVTGNRESMTYPDGQQLVFDHDDADRLEQSYIVGDTVDYPIASYWYQPDGRLVGEFGEATSEGVAVFRSWTYDLPADPGVLAATKPTRYKEAWWGDDEEFDPEDVTEYRAWQLTYDDQDRLASECAYDDPDGVNWGDLSGPAFEECGSTEPGVTTDYDYDTAGQLTEVAIDETTVEEYAYDDSGNRDSVTAYDPVTGLEEWTDDYTVDLASRIDQITRDDGTTPTTTTYAYDDAGRRTTADPATGPTTTHTWDAQGRLTSIAGAATTTIGYNPDGTMSRHTTGGNPTLHLWDTTQPAAQLVETKALFLTFHANYGHRPLQISVGDPETALLAAWMSYDHRGSGLVNDQLINLPDTYTSFGQPIGNTGDPSIGYRGELHLNNHIYLRNRTYDPTTGVFLSPDPLMQSPYGTEHGTPTEANSYHYVANDPLNFVDPLGLCRTTDVVFRGDNVVVGPTGGLSRDECDDPSQQVTCSRQLDLTHCRPAAGPGCFLYDSYYYDEDANYDVEHINDGGCEVIEYYCDGWSFACDIEPWAEHLFVDVEGCLWICLGLTAGDGTLVFDYGCCGLAWPGPGFGITSAPVSEQYFTAVSCGVASGHGGEVTVGESAAGEPYYSLGYSGGLGAFCGPSLTYPLVGG